MAAEHHVLILTVKDVIVMSGSHVKKVRHPSAKICTPDTIKNVFTNSSGPWKLHIIAHGTDNSYTAGSIPNVSADKLGDYVKESGLPNKKGATVRIDSCYAGLGGKGSLVCNLKTDLKNKFKPDNCEIIVEGALGSNIFGWDLKSDKRIVVQPNSKADDKAGEISNYALAKNHVSFERAKSLCANLKPTMPSHILSVLASQIYHLAHGYLSDFNQGIRKQPGILIPRTSSKNYKLQM
jgi:hypothetical protein